MLSTEHNIVVQAMLLELEAILGQRSAHSLATGPVIAEPFISPLLLTITPALSSKYINTPSFLLKGFLCRITTACITEKKYIHINFETTLTSERKLVSMPTGQAAPLKEALSLRHFLFLPLIKS